MCADPNNLPFSNDKGEGFENKLAELVAEELGAELSYTWWAQRRGFIRNTLKAGKCDVVMGVPADYELVATRRRYYRSSYVFVYRSDSGFDVHSMSDPLLRELRIGVHLIGDDGANPPPAHALGQPTPPVNRLLLLLFSQTLALTHPAKHPIRCEGGGAGRRGQFIGHARPTPDHQTCPARSGSSVNQPLRPATGPHSFRGSYEYADAG